MPFNSGAERRKYINPLFIKVKGADLIIIRKILHMNEVPENVLRPSSWSIKFEKCKMKIQSIGPIFW